MHIRITIFAFSDEDTFETVYELIWELMYKNYAQSAYNLCGNK